MTKENRQKDIETFLLRFKYYVYKYKERFNESEWKYIIENFTNFINKYYDYFSFEEWNYIVVNFVPEIDSPVASNTMMQLYGKLGIYPSSADFYNQHLKLIRNLFPLTGKVIEVGAGRFPILANKIAQEQLCVKKGTITIYEPLLIEMGHKYPNMTIHKERFSINTDIQDADLIIGIHPCEATNSILENAIAHHINFYLAMCGCDHSSDASFLDYMDQVPYYFQEDTKEKAKKLMRKYGGGKVEVTTLEDYHNGLPILYNRK